MIKKILFAFILLVSTKVLAQHPLYVHLTEKDDLPDIEFYGVIEDKEGFIWLAADKGLYRYDGKTFKNYSHPKKRGLSVFGLKLDNKGRVWCNNISGQYFYIENDSLKLFTDLKPYTKGQLADFSFFRNQLIACYYPKIIQVDVETKKTTLNFNKDIVVHSFFVQNEDILYISDNSLKVYPENNQERNIFLDIKSNALKSRFIPYKKKLLIYLYNDQNGESRLFIKTKNKLEEITLPKELYKNKVVSFYSDNDFLWLTTNKGVLVCDILNNNLILKKSYFKNKIITNIIKDKNDNYWMTSLREGVFILPNINIEKYQIAQERANISALVKINNNKLLFGTTEGQLTIVDPKNNNLTSYDLEDKQKVFSLAYNRFTNDSYVSQEGRSFIFTKDGFQKEKGTFFMNAKDLTIIDKDYFIYTSFNSALIINLKNNTYKTLNKKRSYTSHYSSKNKNVYVGYVDGIEMYNPDLKSRNITFNNEPIFAIDIDETADGTIWVSTFKDGLIGVKNGEAIFNYTTKNGLLSNQTSTIKADGDYLWIVTDKSLQRFNTRTKTFKNLTKKDGITSFNISDISILNDKICFGSNKGLFQLDKEKVFKTKSLSDFYFTNVLVEDEPVVIQPKYNLSSDVNKIQIQFHTNGYLSEEDIQYQYRLLGASETWTNVEENIHQITFNSLSTGKYKFQLKAVGDQGKIETPIKTIQIKINQVFYKEWWFITICVLLGGLLIIGYYRNKLRIKENEKQLQLEKAAKDRELVFLKLENLRSQMNPHFIFNALNSIQDYILSNKKNLAGDYLGKFADLIRMYLHHSTKGSITLSEEIEALNQYLELEKLRFEDSLNYQIKVNSIFDNDDIEMPTMLIQPYVENAIKHGLLHKKNNRKLSISFTLEKEKQNLLCEVTDNGIGRAKASLLKAKRTHESFASKATTDRLELLNYGKEHKTSVIINDLFSKENEPLGTQVLISIPYTKK